MAQPMYRFPDVWTEADLYDLPDDGHKYEILDGALVMSPAPTGRHQRFGVRLIRLLAESAPPGFEVLYDVNLRVPGGNFEPDIAVLYPGADYDVLWQESNNIALVVEIASPSTRTFDRGAKLLKYAEAGIASYWRVDRDGTITVHELSDGEYRTAAVVRPGTRWSAGLPFPVELDPDYLIN